MNTEFVTQALRSKGFSLTLQRRVILDVLNEKKEHLTADEIYIYAKNKVPNISVGTIYRNLDILVKANLVDQLKKLNSLKSYFEIKKPPHYHIICEKCGKIEDLEGVNIPKLEEEVSKITGYKINSHTIDMYGICPDCRTKSVEIEDLSL